jgi:hypothetical protein
VQSVAGASGLADGTGPLLLQTIPSTPSLTSAAATTVAGTTTGAGVADGTGPLLLHSTPTLSTLTNAISGTGLGLAPKTAAAAKATTLGLAGGGFFALTTIGVATAALGYFEYGWLGGKYDLFDSVDKSMDRCFNKIREAVGGTVKNLSDAFMEGYREGVSGDTTRSRT